ncbi:MAG: glycerol-3-phosphate 1-O-acyltransferase PlsY [Eubacterium sp.]
MSILVRLFCIIMGYIFGLFQTGYIYGKLKKVDIRKFGSGNSGTTNTMRVLGKKAGIITYLGDTLKVVIACCITRLLFADNYPDILFALILYTGLGTVLGHNFPFYMNFKGGKGIAVTSGVVISLFDWKLFVLGFATFAIITLVSKYVSLGSLCGITGFLIELIIFGQLDMLTEFGTKWNLTLSCRIEAYIITFLLVLLAFIRHRSNIIRLINGTELKIGQKKVEE